MLTHVQPVKVPRMISDELQNAGLNNYSNNNKNKTWNFTTVVHYFTPGYWNPLTVTLNWQIEFDVIKLTAGFEMGPFKDRMTACQLSGLSDQ